jgi:hypothetical protein
VLKRVWTVSLAATRLHVSSAHGLKQSPPRALARPVGNHGLVRTSCSATWLLFGNISGDNLERKNFGLQCRVSRETRMLLATGLGVRHSKHSLGSRIVTPSQMRSTKTLVKKSRHRRSLDPSTKQLGNRAGACDSLLCAGTTSSAVWMEEVLRRTQVLSWKWITLSLGMTAAKP